MISLALCCNRRPSPPGSPLWREDRPDSEAPANPFPRQYMEGRSIAALRVIRVKGFYKIPGTDTHKTPSPTTVYEGSCTRTGAGRGAELPSPERISAES